MAHLFEHMFFKGSKKFPGAEEIAQELAAVGGETNAGTIYDSTNYYFVMPKEGFAARRRDPGRRDRPPALRPRRARRRRPKSSSRSRTASSTTRRPLSIERMFATAFTQHRIKRWRIGSNEVLRNIRRDNLVAFFETLYRPENIIVTIAGDVRTRRPKRWSASDVRRAPARDAARRSAGPTEPAQTEFRFGQLRRPTSGRATPSSAGTRRVSGSADEQALDCSRGSSATAARRGSTAHVVGPDGASTASASH